MNNQFLKKCTIAVVLSALAMTLFCSCGANSGGTDSAGAEKKDNAFHNASFSLERQEVEHDVVSFNGMSFEVPTAWRTAEEDGLTVYYPNDDETDMIRIHEGSAEQAYDHQQDLVNAKYEELMKDRIDAGCFVESHDLNIAGHRGKWFRSDVNYVGEDGQPLPGYDEDETMKGHLRECVLFAVNEQDYLLLEAIYPMGSMTEDEFGVFYKSTHYHR